MAKTKLFEDPERGTSLTFRVWYDSQEGLVTVWSCMHAADEPPPVLRTIGSVNLDKTGWWAVRNLISEELSAYVHCEDARGRAATPF